MGIVETRTHELMDAGISPSEYAKFKAAYKEKYGSVVNIDTARNYAKTHVPKKKATSGTIKENIRSMMDDDYDFTDVVSFQDNYFNLFGQAVDEDTIRRHGVNYQNEKDATLVEADDVDAEASSPAIDNQLIVDIQMVQEITQSINGGFKRLKDVVMVMDAIGDDDEVAAFIHAIVKIEHVLSK